MAPGIPVRDLVPETHLVLVQLPAQADNSPLTLSGKVDEALLEPLEVDAEFAQLPQVPFDLGSQPPHLILQRRDVRRRRIGPRPGRGILVGLHRPRPGTVRVDDITDDPPDEWEHPVGLLHRERARGRPAAHRWSSRDCFSCSRSSSRRRRRSRAAW